MSLFFYASKCFICGFAMCFPGLSGASASSILGIYGEMLGLVKKVFSDFKTGVFRLFITAASVSAGALIFCLIFGNAVKNNPKLFLYAGSFITTVGLVYFAKTSRIFRDGFSFSYILYFAVGFIIPFSEKLLEESVSVSFSGKPYTLILCGIFLAVALILPGISFSYMLSFLGLYDKVITYLSERNFPPLILLGIGILFGILIFSTLVSRFIEKKKAESDRFIVGFIVSAVINSFI